MEAVKDLRFGRHLLDLGERVAQFAAGDANSRGGSRKLLATGYDAVLCLNGTLKWNVFCEELIQQKGEFFLIPPGTYYELLGGDQDPVIVHLRLVEKNKGAELLKDFKLGIYAVDCDILCEAFLNVSREIVETTEVEGLKLTESLVEQSKNLYDHLQDYLRCSHYCIAEKKVSAKKASFELIGKVYTAVSKGSDATIEGISEDIGVSPSYLARVFKNTCGITPKQYLNIYKINKSLEDLNKSKRDLSELSIDMGFTDQSHFTNVFKRFLNTTPGELKRQSKSS